MHSWVKSWAFFVLYALDLLVNTLAGGSPHETLSSRCYRLNHLRVYRWLEKVINTLAYPFDGPNHCEESYRNIVSGIYLPPRFYLKDPHE